MGFNNGCNLLNDMIRRVENVNYLPHVFVLKTLIQAKLVNNIVVQVKNTVLFTLAV